MPSIVTIEISNGLLVGQRFEFSGPSRCDIGRGKDCTIQIPECYSSVFRRHCALEVNPPHVSVRDLGSLHGTYLNGECIGRRERDGLSERRTESNLRHQLKDGDELLLGGGRNSTKRKIALRIHAAVILLTPTQFCAVCGSESEGTSETATFDKVVCAPCRNDREALLRHLEVVDEAGAALGALSNYVLLQTIGRGGFGSVFLARHARTGRKVALKVMLPHLAHDPMMRQIFQREIENMKALRHPHVVELFEDGCAGGVYYFAMEYCSLGSVSDLLKIRGGTLSIGEALELIYGAIDGLHYAHHAPIPNVRLADGSYASGNGIVHRDIKPGNLLLDQVAGKIVVKVGDFGLSKAWEQAGYSGVTRPGTKAGSFAFQPRQQVRGYRDSQPEVDVWAMAATLYFLLTGSTPRDFPAHIAPELVVLQHPVVKIRQRNPAIPQNLGDVIDKVLDDDSDLAVKNIGVFKRALKSTA